MTLEEYVNNLNQLLKTNPELKSFKVVYAKDAEGNGFDELYNEPTIGFFDEYEDDFVPKSQFKDWEYEDGKENSICIN